MKQSLLTGDVGVLGQDGLTLDKSRSSGSGEGAGETPENVDMGVGGADVLLDGAARRFFSLSSCGGFSRKKSRCYDSIKDQHRHKPYS